MRTSFKLALLSALPAASASSTRIEEAGLPGGAAGARLKECRR
ncbi:MAG TPA: hypothetical protein VGB69_01145 [Edaphobacter sp.]